MRILFFHAEGGEHLEFLIQRARSFEKEIDGQRRNREKAAAEVKNDGAGSKSAG